VITMDAILVVNAGSSSLKFQVFGTDTGGLERLIKGQIDGVGTRPRLRAEYGDKTPLIDESYPSDAVPDLPAAIHHAGAWLRNTQNLNLVAVGHRVVHGGPEYDRPLLVDNRVLSHLERYIPLAPLHQPNNLAPIRSLLSRFSRSSTGRLLRHRISPRTQRGGGLLRDPPTVI
jgi:acetate kinase